MPPRAPRIGTRTQPDYDGTQIERLADLVASGEIPFPHDLSGHDQQLLLASVSHRRRDRLIKFVARAIAQDIHSSRSH